MSPSHKLEKNSTRHPSWKYYLDLMAYQLVFSLFFSILLVHLHLLILMSEQRLPLQQKVGKFYQDLHTIVPEANLPSFSNVLYTRYLICWYVGMLQGFLKLQYPTIDHNFKSSSRTNFFHAFFLISSIPFFRIVLAH
jgi:hypothetical protein